MLAELSRSIALSEDILKLCGKSIATARPTPHPQAATLLSSIASSGIPRFHDSRVPPDVSSKLHGLAEEHFQRACRLLEGSHAHLGLVQLQQRAFALKATYVHIYERQVLQIASRSIKHCSTEKQPFANDILVYAFEQSQTPSKRERERLAALTGMSLEQVRVWFQNRRSRQKKKGANLPPRPALALPDLLERIAASARSSNTPKQLESEEHFEDNDVRQSYSTGCARTCAPTSPHWPTSRETTPLATPSSTPRSYPALYVPQGLTALSNFEAPIWRRTSAACLPSCSVTVTVDELTRSMSKLTLRHRREKPCSIIPAGGVPLPATEAVIAASIPALVPQARSKKKTQCTGVDSARRVAGGRRLASSSCHSLAASPPGPGVGAALPPAQISASTVGTAASKPRKQAGPPRRKPGGRALSRQASNSSVATSSSSSSDSSRSTSYASDYSLRSVASDSSFSSVDSAWVTPGSTHSEPSLHAAQERTCGLAELLTPYPHVGTGSDLLVYDFSVVPGEISGFALPVIDDPLNDPTMLQLLHDAQLHQQQRPSLGSVQVPAQEPALGQQLDVDLGVDVFVDFSSAPFANLDALLGSEPPTSNIGALRSSHPGAFNWCDLSLGILSRA